MVPNLRFIGLCDRGTLRWVRLCLTTPFAKLQLQMMGAFAEFERNIIRKRQAEGIAKAKERGVYKNRTRKTTIDRNEVKRLKSEGLSTYKIADAMKISRMSVHRILNA